jgi:hypothetical protein
VAGSAEFHFIGISQSHVEQAREDCPRDKDDGNEYYGYFARTGSEHTPPLVLLVCFCISY